MPFFPRSSRCGGPPCRSGRPWRSWAVDTGCGISKICVRQWLSGQDFGHGKLHGNVFPYARVSFRGSRAPTAHLGNLGLRLVLTAP